MLSSSNTAVPLTSVFSTALVNVLLVSVCVSEVPTTVPVGAATVAIVPNPRVVLCAAASASSRRAFPAEVSV